GRVGKGRGEHPGGWVAEADEPDPQPPEPGKTGGAGIDGHQDPPRRDAEVWRAGVAVQGRNGAAELGEEPELQAQHLEPELAGNVVLEDVRGLRLQHGTETPEFAGAAGLGRGTLDDRRELPASPQLHRLVPAPAEARQADGTRFVERHGRQQPERLAGSVLGLAAGHMLAALARQDAAGLARERPEFTEEILRVLDGRATIGLLEERPQPGAPRRLARRAAEEAGERAIATRKAERF